MIELDFYIEERKEAYYRRLYGKLATASEEELDRITVTVYKIPL